MHMHPEQWHDLMRDRMAEERARAEQRRLARSVVHRPSLRARTARMFFRMAFAVEAEETWRILRESPAGGSRAPQRGRRVV